MKQHSTVRREARSAPTRTPSRAHPPRSSAPSLTDLQALIGNRALQTLLVPSCTCGGSCAECSARDELADLVPGTGPLPGLLDEEEAPPPGSLAAFVPRADSANLDPAKQAGGIECQHGTMNVWVVPGLSPCLEPCVRRHEEKHISDFEGDPDYKDACVGIPDGKTFLYHSGADRERFETAATDLEIDCLDGELITETDPKCRKEMTQRRDVDLPKYKRDVKSTGC